MFCATLARDRAACQQITRVHRQSEVSRSVSNTAREDLARRFGAYCRRGSALQFGQCRLGQFQTNSTTVLKLSSD
eukprot:7873555-Karenia_brevis.AAC.1